MPDSIFVGASELAGLMRATDWHATSLGAPSQWPQSVRAIIRLMLTSRYAMWMGWGPGLTFLYNDAYARMTLGGKHPWALGRPASEVWAEIWPEIGPRIDHVLRTGEATWDEGLQLFLERHGFREETYHTFSYSPLHQDDGRIAGMFCVVTEETDRLIGERRLDLLRTLGANLAASRDTAEVWQAVQQTLDADGRDLPFALAYLFDSNDAAATLVMRNNVGDDESLAPATPSIDADPWHLRCVQQESGPRLRVIDLPADVVRPRGPWSEPPTRAMVVPIAQPGQKRPAGVFIAGLNPHRPLASDFESFITLFVGQIAAALANAEAYAHQRLRAEALAQIDRAKTTFFSNVSHELRTPLTLLLAPVTEAVTTKDGVVQGPALELVHRNALRLQKLVNALLDLSRLEAGRVEPNFEPVDLGPYTADLASTFRSLVEGAGLRFVVDCPSDESPIFVDREMWEQIVLNLVSNAFKFTFAGEIRVVVTHSEHGAQLTVRDTGIGIAPEEVTHVFDRFHRVEGAVGRTHEGTGIGLALVQELVRLHGGTARVDSEVGAGTTFSITLRAGTAYLPAGRIGRQPVARRTGLHPDAFVDEAARWLSQDSGASETDTGDRAPGPSHAADATATILLADDNIDMRRYLRTLLGSRWRVLEAVDGREALNTALEQPPDLVVTDVMMPQLDGFALLRELRADERTRHVPVMMLSARAGEESRLEGLHAGADDYLVKPFTVRELFARVEAQLLRSGIRKVEERSARRLASVFAQAPVPIAILRGPTHVFETANDAYERLVNRPVIGKPVAEAFPEVASQGLIELLDRVYTTGERYVGNALPLRIADGPSTLQQHYYDFVYEPLLDASGTVEGIAAVVYDVTDLASARRAAEMANRTKDEFLAMLGHEFRNPLAPIVTALQLLRLRGVEGGERERTIIERQVRHLVGLVDDLLDISRITQGKVRLTPRPIEMNELVVKAIELASPLLEQHQHTLLTDVPRTGLRVDADPARFAQVISNLLTNAAKYTPPGGHIRITATGVGDVVELRVRDTGIGITADMLPRIFDLFTQDRQAIDRSQGGLGLGLSIVRSLVQLHGGTVTARSDGPGAGSEFVLRLPRLAHESPRRDATPPARALPRLRSGLRVIVVDDNEDAAMMLADLLRAEGHEASVAADGPTALAEALRLKPDVALLDLGLPVMDGFELAYQLRLIPELRPLRLAAITGYGQEHDRERSASAGFDAHFVKPVDLDDLNRFLGGVVPRT